MRTTVGSLGKESVAVLGGFIGSTEDCVTTTLGRGGSDFTAALVGAALEADEIEIWTDVDGVLTCDPTLVPDAHPVKTISFEEGRVPRPICNPVGTTVCWPAAVPGCTTDW